MAEKSEWTQVRTLPGGHDPFTKVLIRAVTRSFMEREPWAICFDGEYWTADPISRCKSWFAVLTVDPDGEVRPRERD